MASRNTQTSRVEITALNANYPVSRVTQETKVEIVALNPSYPVSRVTQASRVIIATRFPVTGAIRPLTGYGT